MGIASGTLSVAMLVKLGVEASFTAPLILLLEAYNQAVNLLLGWLEPLVVAWLHSINEYFGFELRLHPHWKHIFVLLWVYFASDVRANKTVGRQGHAGASIFWGAGVAVTASAVAGVFPLNQSWEGHLVLISFLSGMILYELGQAIWCGLFRLSNPSFDAHERTRFEVFRHCLVSYVLPIGILGALAHIVWWWTFDWHTALLHGNLLAVALFLLLLALYWMARGIYLALYYRKQGESYHDRFWRSGSSHVALGLLAIVSGTILFFLLNAGLKLAGL